jgi:hypothetical protein
MPIQKSFLLVSTMCGPGRPIRWLADVLATAAGIFNDLQKTLKDAQKHHPYFVEL